MANVDRLKDKNGRIDYRLLDPFSRPESTWTDSDRQWVELRAREEAERIAQKNQRKHGNAAYQQALQAELEKLNRPVQPRQQSQSELNRIFGDDVVEYDDGDGNVTTRRV